MKRILQISVATVAIWSAASAVPAFAQRACPEGRTASGQCVNAGLAAAIEQSGILFSQPKISYTALPILPSGDLEFRYPYNLIRPDDAEGGRNFAAAAAKSIIEAVADRPVHQEFDDIHPGRRRSRDGWFEYRPLIDERCQ